MKNIKIYLAGAISKLSIQDMNSWRIKATNLLEETEYPIHVENPCNYFNPVTCGGTYTELQAKEFDLWLVKNCDLILVNLDFPDSIGTAIELDRAYNIYGKPVIAFGTAKNHPWIELSVTKRCDTLEEAVEHIRDFYLENI
jgi:nucleoside 2-deoxyribosyltransferase